MLNLLPSMLPSSGEWPWQKWQYKYNDTITKKYYTLNTQSNGLQLTTNPEKCFRFVLVGMYYFRRTAVVNTCSRRRVGCIVKYLIVRDSAYVCVMVCVDS